MLSASSTTWVDSDDNLFFGIFCKEYYVLSFAEEFEWYSIDVCFKVSTCNFFINSGENNPTCSEVLFNPEMI